MSLVTPKSTFVKMLKEKLVVSIPVNSYCILTVPLPDFQDRSHNGLDRSDHDVDLALFTFFFDSKDFFLVSFCSFLNSDKSLPTGEETKATKCE